MGAEVGELPDTLGDGDLCGEVGVEVGDVAIAVKLDDDRAALIAHRERGEAQGAEVEGA